MRLVGFGFGLLILAAGLPAQTQNWREQLTSKATFGTIRGIFLNHTIVVRGFPIGSAIPNWYTALKQGDQYDWYVTERGIPEGLPSTYKGKAAMVITVQLHRTERKEQKVNAVGEIVSDDAMVNPYFDIVVRFDDGRLAILSAYPQVVADHIEMASSAGDAATQLAMELPLLIGNSLYAVGYSNLYRPETTLDELMNGSAKKLVGSNAPRLVPLRIEIARYVDGAGVIFKLNLPDGSDVLSFTEESDFYHKNLDKPPLQRLAGNLLVGIPEGLTRQDIDAIRKGRVSTGMASYVLYYALGYPDQTNDWGRSGKQLIYGHRIFYLDENGKVVDEQFLDK